MRFFFCLAAVIICSSKPALAHASEQGFVLLLPTTLYVSGGVASVALTVILIAMLPPHIAQSLFHPFRLGPSIGRRGAVPISCISFFCLFALVLIGGLGPHDPNRNALPLAIWSLFWVLFVTSQAIFGDLWRYVNPWSGPYSLLRRLGFAPRLQLPSHVGYWPGFLSFLAFASVLLAYPAPSDPEQLAVLVSLYWLFHFVGMLAFGPRWLRRAEGLTILLVCYANISVIGASRGHLNAGLWGWKTILRPAPPLSLAVFCITILAIGSFDGLNETFWWFGKIGVNPLEFPGRSAVVSETLTGILFTVPALIAAYALSVWLGVRLINHEPAFGLAFCTLAPAILPIALGYHIGHYFPSFLIEIQYVARTFCSGIGLCDVQVTTGFFKTLATVKVIWLSQAGAVVLGHVVAILLSHVLALRLFGCHRKAAISQTPLAIFMILYTIFGLWLLAAPRGA
ncbi:MAG: hypothetical protein ABJI96_03050 [Paracoccaceae bacterium]